MDMYHEEILEHYRHPHNQGKLEDADIMQKELNPTCGDKLTFYLKFDNGKVTDVKWSGEGCAISQAASSMLTDELEGMSIDDIAKLQKEDILDLLGIELGPTRLKCALLSLQGITNAIAKIK